MSDSRLAGRGEMPSVTIEAKIEAILDAAKAPKEFACTRCQRPQTNLTVLIDCSQDLSVGVEDQTCERSVVSAHQALRLPARSCEFYEENLPILAVGQLVSCRSQRGDRCKEIILRPFDLPAVQEPKAVPVDYP